MCLGRSPVSTAAPCAEAPSNASSSASCYGVLNDHTHVLEEEVSCAVLVKDLNPVDGALCNINQRHAGGSLANDQGVDANVVRTDPKGIHRLLRIQTDRAVLLFFEVERELTLKQRREWPKCEVVRARCSGFGEREEVELPVDLRGVSRPGNPSVASPALHVV